MYLHEKSLKRCDQKILKLPWTISETVFENPKSLFKKIQKAAFLIFT